MTKPHIVIRAATDTLLDIESAEELLFAPKRTGNVLAWVITHGSIEYPDRFCARAWVFQVIDNQQIMEAQPLVLLANDLRAIRGLIPAIRALHCYPRSAHDDPVIVETWI